MDVCRTSAKTWFVTLGCLCMRDISDSIQNWPCLAQMFLLFSLFFSFHSFYVWIMNINFNLIHRSFRKFRQIYSLQSASLCFFLFLHLFSSFAEIYFYATSLILVSFEKMLNNFELQIKNGCCSLFTRRKTLYLIFVWHWKNVAFQNQILQKNTGFLFERRVLPICDWIFRLIWRINFDFKFSTHQFIHSKEEILEEKNNWIMGVSCNFSRFPRVSDK